MTKKKKTTMYSTILENDQLNSIYTNIIDDLSKENLDSEQIANALLATTSMGFNDLFNILSRMIVNSHVLETYTKSNDELDAEFIDIQSQVITLIKNIGTSIEDTKVSNLTTKLNEFMAKHQPEGTVDESTTDSEVDEDSAEDLS